jgi:predicted NBD/HSP70 family sugar kinase
MWRWLSMEKELLIIGIEASIVTQVRATVRTPGVVPEITRLPSWDPRPFSDDPTGRRLFEEVARHCKQVISSQKGAPPSLAITLPGSIQGTTLLSRSSRLGVMQPLDVGLLFKDLGLSSVCLLRDVDCLALGEQALNTEGTPADNNDFIYILVDEGVGSFIQIFGKSYRGAGHAGPIGRLIVEPDGAYNNSFRCSGPLEVFLGRPSISQNIINLYLIEAGKRGAVGSVSEQFRRAVAVAASNDPKSLPYSVIQQGVTAGDPLALTVIDRAAHYLGIAISSVVTILNPPTIVLAGGVISEFPALTEAALNYARRYSWEQAWNSTTIRLGRSGRDHQYIGAAILASTNSQHRDDSET